MKQLLTSALDWLFPPTRAERIVRSTSRAAVLTHYEPRRQAGVTALCPYRAPLVSTLIQEHKFAGNPLAAQHLASLLERWLETQTPAVVLVPIPLSAERLRARGFNQVEQILQRVPHQHLERNLFHRTRDTVPQSQLSRAARFTNVANAFTVNQTRLAQLAGSTLIVVDDVVTTGATLQAARASLAPLLPPNTSVTYLAIAYA